MAAGAPISIGASVGQGAANKPADVTAVQGRLNELMGDTRIPLVVDGLCGPKTRAMIADFQKSVLKFKWPDSRIDPHGKTLAALNDPASANTWRGVPPVGPTGKKKAVNLHFRSISLTNVSFADQFKACVDVYAQYNIDMRFQSGLSRKLSDEDRAKFNRVDTSCVAGNDEWAALQTVTNDAPATDICVVFVGELWDPAESPGKEMFLGCGAYRPGAPACAVAANGNLYDMAHEVGHVLGLSHDTTVGNLMHPTQDTYIGLPKLTPEQLVKLHASPLCR